MKIVLRLGRNLTIVAHLVRWRNGLEDRNFNTRVVIGNHHCTSCINLVKFGSVTPEFKTSEVVQSASKIFLGCLQVRSIRGGAAGQCGDQ